MWPSRISYSNSCQGLSAWFLLADCESSGRRVGQALQGVSKIQGQESSASMNTQDYSDHMAIRSMGTGHGRTIQDIQRWHDTFAGGSGQVYQVDRGKADQEAGWADCG